MKYRDDLVDFLAKNQPSGLAFEFFVHAKVLSDNLTNRFNPLGMAKTYIKSAVYDPATSAATVDFWHRFFQ